MVDAVGPRGGGAASQKGRPARKSARSGGAKPEAAVQPYLGSEFKQADALVTSPNLYGELHQCVLRVIIIWKCLKLRAE